MKKSFIVLCLFVFLNSIVLVACRNNTDNESSIISEKSAALSEESLSSDENSESSDINSANEVSSLAVSASSSASNQIELLLTDEVCESFEIDADLRKKLIQLKKKLTIEEVHDLLGEADEFPETGIYWEYFYINGNKQKRVQIAYFSDGIIVQLGDTEHHNGIVLIE